MHIRAHSRVMPERLPIVTEEATKAHRANSAASIPILVNGNIPTPVFERFRSDKAGNIAVDQVDFDYGRGDLDHGIDGEVKRTHIIRSPKNMGKDAVSKQPEKTKKRWFAR